ncbi:Zinc transporter foi isoform 4 [Schistosoma japonicum]|nr:Zinc transporter foi [Schistosoma japonicum]KAH8876586.1 Zinc transporter foi [Schistosoma japonicum]KAH8876587.1 Zinc transporter foi [Schistosoma japonicum]KAH8876588.1 Zinc transporter foi [Schistosoma japonicum]KAH8876589.1 Zinc transporter foi [Schistosoma japonicum]
MCMELYRIVTDSRNNSQDGNEMLNVYSFWNIRSKVWIASLISIFVISAVGLLGVGVVPLVQKVFYNHVIQYLVALAVGTLTGDAMLHLLPHAISGGQGHAHEGGTSEEEDGERIAILKGLVALGGVYFFFMAEKILSLTSEHRAEKKLEKEDRERALHNLPIAPGTRRLSSIRTSLVPGGHLTVPGQTRRLSQFDPTSCRRASRAMSIANEDVFVTGLSSKAMKSIDILYSYAEEYDELTRRSSQDIGLDQPITKTELQLRLPDGKSKQINQMNASNKDLQKQPQLQASSAINVPNITIEENDDKVEKTSEVKMKDPDKQLRIDLPDHHEEEEKSFNHEHSHSHSHEVPESVAAVAWMVIMGDGLHNFTDGMAIGAAFAQSISGGLSTSVAVFCHELPHELGDFAVLLKTGMRIKEAMFFNIISSILCLFGMLVGIAVGNIESASYWIFSITAGTFIYIALVDMLPELNSAELRPGQTRIGQLVIQTAGLTTGVGIMLVIALFEDSIRVIVD